MKKLSFALIVSLMTLMVSSCQYCTRQTGGTTTIDLDENQKFVNATWKENDIWVLTQDIDNPKTFRFREYSNFGVFQGEVVITEK